MKTIRILSVCLLPIAAIMVFLHGTQLFAEVPVTAGQIAGLRTAAAQGDASAQCSLGACYAKGEGVPVDEAEAVKWITKAANQEFAKAQFNLGVCYGGGLGVPKDAAKAVTWYRKAADQGFANAQFYLGACYAKGDGVPKEIGRAHV